MDEFKKAPWEEAMSLRIIDSNWCERCPGQVGYRNRQLFVSNVSDSYVYEIGIKIPRYGTVCVYVGMTTSGKREATYLCGGSHLSERINKVLEQSETLTIVMRKVYRPNPAKVEEQLLAKYNYAWNKINNKPRRNLTRQGYTLSEDD